MRPRDRIPWAELTASAVPERLQEESLRRRGLYLAIFIIVWDVIEAGVTVTAGLAAGSIALIGFGIDSSIEVFAAGVVVWQLRGASDERRQRALQLIGTTFFALAVYVSIEAVRESPSSR